MRVLETIGREQVGQSGRLAPPAPRHRRPDRQRCGDCLRPAWTKLTRWLHMLGFRGHFATKSRRYSVILGRLRAERRTWRLRRVEAHLAAQVPTSPDALVFTAAKGGPLFRGTFARDVWRPASRRAGITGVTFHGLRHSFVAILVAAGATSVRSPSGPGTTAWRSRSPGTAGWSRTDQRQRWTVSTRCSVAAPSRGRGLMRRARSTATTVGLRPRFVSGDRLALKAGRLLTAFPLVRGQLVLVAPTGFEPALLP